MTSSTKSGKATPIMSRIHPDGRGIAIAIVTGKTRGMPRERMVMRQRAVLVEAVSSCKTAHVVVEID